MPYRATGLSWRAGPMPNQGQILLDTFLDEIEGLDPDALWAARLGLKLTAEDRETLLSRIQAIFQEYVDRGPDPEGDPISIYFVEHPDLPRAQRAALRAAAARRVRSAAATRDGWRLPASNSSRSPVSPARTAPAADDPLVDQERGERDRADADLHRPRPGLAGDEALDDARDEAARAISPITIVNSARPSSASAWPRVRAPGAIHAQKMRSPAAPATKIAYSSSRPCGAMYRKNVSTWSNCEP